MIRTSGSILFAVDLLIISHSKKKNVHYLFKLFMWKSSRKLGNNVYYDDTESIGSLFTRYQFELIDWLNDVLRFFQQCFSYIVAASVPIRAFL